jgi:N-acetylmuramoyl-L-alanine amidase
MKRKVIYLLAFVVMLGLLNSAGVAFGRDPAELLKSADQCRRALIQSAPKKKYRHNWLKCINKYKHIYSKYSKSDQAAWALYHAAGLFAGLSRYSGRSKDVDEAVALYRNLAEQYPTHRLADDAQYKLGEIYRRIKKDPSQAYVEFLKVDIQFPSGDMRPRARAQMDELARILSKKEEQAANQEVSASADRPVSVKEIRHWSTPNYTRVVVDLEGPVKYNHHLLRPDPDLKKPRRLYLDLKGARVSSEIDGQVPIGDGLLQRARAAQYTRDTVRVVLDSGSIGGYKVFHLYDPFRIVVDVKRREEDQGNRGATAASQKARVRKGVRKAEQPDGSISLARQLGLSVRRIVIDPGHGGKDPGCNIRGSIREKDIVLDIAKILAKKIERQLGCEVFLTRNRDVFLSLEQRTAIANMKKADLFVSLHVNAHKNQRIWGLETYYLNIATDERAVMVAARENATSEKNISDLQAILNDLMLNTKINESSRLADTVQKGLVGSVKSRYNTVKSLGVKQAPFYVLIGAEMPAVLVEIGFLTNPVERKRLVSATYRQSVAQGITDGIQNYVRSIGQVGWAQP